MVSDIGDNVQFKFGGKDRKFLYLRLRTGLFLFVFLISVVSKKK